MGNKDFLSLNIRGGQFSNIVGRVNGGIFGRGYQRKEENHTF